MEGKLKKALLQWKELRYIKPSGTDVPPPLQGRFLVYDYFCEFWRRNPPALTCRLPYKGGNYSNPLL